MDVGKLMQENDELRIKLQAAIQRISELEAKNPVRGSSEREPVRHIHPVPKKIDEDKRG